MCYYTVDKLKINSKRLRIFSLRSLHFKKGKIIMKQHLNKKAFTIVELVIVIAVIAILAAVLIPTFASLVKKANMSSDEIAVKNMNTALSAVHPAPQSFNEAKKALAEAGYNTAKSIIPITENHIFVWSEADNKILHVEVTDEGRRVIYPEDYKGTLEGNQNYYDLSLPGAKVTVNGAQTVDGYIVDFGSWGNTMNRPSAAGLHCSYTFAFAEPDEAVQNSEYADWIADFVISFDKDVSGGVQLAGQYESFLEDWIVIDSAEALSAFGESVLAAGERIPLLGLVGLEYTYADINSMMEVFNCGAGDDGTNSGTTMTVELCLTNPNDASDYRIVTTHSYTFR